jgi:hypothetical protein
MKLKWKAIDRFGRVLGRGRFASCGAAFVAAHAKYGDRFSAVLVDRDGAPKVKPSAADLAPAIGRENFPSWDAGR